jgi:hypothetical protein
MDLSRNTPIAEYEVAADARRGDVEISAQGIAGPFVGEGQWSAAWNRCPRSDTTTVVTSNADRHRMPNPQSAAPDSRRIPHW